MIDGDEEWDGTRSESREGTRWMGKHVGVDFVDSTHPSVNHIKLLLLPSVYPFLRLSPSTPIQTQGVEQRVLTR
jgi:hypothetical protein